MQTIVPQGRVSWRKFFTVALSTLVAIFAYLLISSPLAHAADMAQWKDGNLVYQNNTYKNAPPAKGGDGYNLPDGTIIYLHPDITSNPAKSNIIYFEPGSDPAKADHALTATYTLGPGGGLTDKTDVQTIQIDTGTQAEATHKPSGQSTGSCQLTGGMAWIICPLTNTLASAMDWVFNVVASYLDVQPLATTSTTDKNAMMGMWNMIRNIANVIFVIAFIVIIYSQLTSLGLSNYGVKKMLPRLIVGAILVNISYWVCAIGIDLSNILGHSFEAMFMTMRNTIADMHDVQGWQFVDWQSFVSFVAVGGGATAGGAALWITTAAKIGAITNVTGIMMTILPTLVIIFLVILMVLFILAARQAIIFLLVVVSPLAFVAYLLPNTEKWFEKWREAFVDLLIFFPAFSLVFGGAQLASIAIMRTAQNVSMVILALAIQVAPLAIVPLILKLSNGLLARFAGVINNPRKGLIGKTRDWANERREASLANTMRQTRQMADTGQLRRRHIMRRTALHHDNEHRMRAGLKAVDEETATSLFNRSAEGVDLARAQSNSTKFKEQVGNEVNTAIQREINMKGSEMHLNNMRLEASKVVLENQTKQTAGDLEEYKSGRAIVAGEMSDLMNTMRDTTVLNYAETQRAQSATNMQQKMIASSFTSEGLAANALRSIAAGVDPNGVVRAQANAEAALTKIEKEARDNTIQLLNMKALNSGQTLKAYTNSIIKDATVNASTSFNAAEIEAALEQQAMEGNVWGLEEARGSTHIDQAMLSRVIARNAGTMKQKGGFHLQDNPDLSIDVIREKNPSASSEQIQQIFEQNMAAARIKSFAETSPDSLTDFKVGYFAKVSQELDGIIKLARSSGDKDVENNLKAMYRNIHTATVNPDISRRMAAGPDALKDMDNALRANSVPLERTPEDIANEESNPPHDTGPKD